MVTDPEHGVIGTATKYGNNYHLICNEFKDGEPYCYEVQQHFDRKRIFGIDDIVILVHRILND